MRSLSACDCLMEVTAWIGLTVLKIYLVLPFMYVLGVFM